MANVLNSVLLHRFACQYQVVTIDPGFPILGVFRLKGQPKRDGSGIVRSWKAIQSRKPTPLQPARWKAVQKAKRKGLSIRGIARELSIHRDTVRKYIDAESPPMSPARATSAVP